MDADAPLEPRRECWRREKGPAAWKLGRPAAEDEAGEEELPFVAGQLENVHDALELPHVHEAALLDLIRRRFLDGCPCTWVGTVLVSVNPGRPLQGVQGIGEDYFDLVQGAFDGGSSSAASSPSSRRNSALESKASAAADPSGGRSPSSSVSSWASVTSTVSTAAVSAVSPQAHLAGVADRAYASMMAGPTRRTQTIMVNGESGAGKTEAAKFLTRCLARKSRRARAVAAKASKSKVDNYFGKMGLGSPVSLGRRGGRGSRGRGRGLAALAPPPAEPRSEISSAVEEYMITVSPVFEAFGNAATENNHNSSRFGKFLQLDYDRDGVLIGAQTRHFLLEKTRVVGHASRQRNFHVFYQLLASIRRLDQDRGEREHRDSSEGPAGASDSSDTEVSEREAAVSGEFALEAAGDVSEYRYLTPSGAGQTQTPAQAGADVEAMQRVCAALDEIGVDARHRKVVWQTLLCVLEVGNLQFLSADRGHGLDGCSVDRLDARAAAALDRVAAFLAVDVDVLDKALCFRTVSAGGSKRSSVLSHPLTAEEATASRDGLAKALYTALFDFIVSTVNLRINAGNADKQASASIGLLDVFGFEVTQRNSFEQLCMNYANEKLQHKFETHLVAAERAFLEDEGLDVEADMAVFHDSSAVIKAIDDRACGVFAVLDEASALQLGDDAFVAALRAKLEQQEQQGRPHLIEIPRQAGALVFVVRHRAGDLEYDVRGFVEKNADALQADVADMLLQSKNEFIARLFQASTASEDANLTSSTAARDVNAENAQPAVGGQRHSQRMGAVTAHFKAVRTMASTKTISGLFRRQLAFLDDAMEATSVHFVRCVRPQIAAGNVERRIDGDEAASSSTSASSSDAAGSVERPLDDGDESATSETGPAEDSETGPAEDSGASLELSNDVDETPEFDGELVLNQLHHLSVLEMVRFRARGFCERIPHELFASRFCGLAVRSGCAAGPISAQRKVSARLLGQVLQDGAFFRIGLDHVLLQPRALARLDALEKIVETAAARTMQKAARAVLLVDSKVLEASATRLQACWRARCAVLAFRAQQKATIRLAAWWRARTALQKFAAACKAVCRLQSVARMLGPRHLWRRKTHGAASIQAYFRYWRRRRGVRRLRARCAASRIRAWYRGAVAKRLKRAKDANQTRKLPWADSMQAEDVLRHEASVVCESALHKDLLPKVTGVPEQAEAHLLLLQNRFVLTTSAQAIDELLLTPETRVYARDRHHFFVAGVSPHLDAVYAFRDPRGRAVEWVLAFFKPLTALDLFAETAPDAAGKASARCGPLQLRQSGAVHHIFADGESVGTERSSSTCTASVSSLTSASAASRAQRVASSLRSKFSRQKQSRPSTTVYCAVQNGAMLMYESAQAKDPLAALSLSSRFTFRLLAEEDAPHRVETDDISVPDATLEFTSESSQTVNKWAEILDACHLAPVALAKGATYTMDVPRIVRQGLDLEREQRFADAVAVFTHAANELGWPRVKSNATAAESYMHRCACNMERRWFCAAVHCAEMALVAAPQSAEAHLRKGLALMALHLEERAKAALEEALRLDDGLVEARTVLANLNDKEKGHRMCTIPKLKMTTKLKRSKSSRGSNFD